MDMQSDSDGSDSERLSSRAAAEFLGVSRSWLAQLRLAGQGPQPVEEPRRPGVALYYTLGELKAWRRRFAEARAKAAAKRYLPMEGT